MAETMESPGGGVCTVLPKERNEAFMRHSRYAEGTPMVFGVPRGRALPQMRTGKEWTAYGPSAFAFEIVERVPKNRGRNQSLSAGN